MSTYTNTNLVTAIRQLAALPDGESTSDTWNTDNVLLRAYDVLLDEVIPKIVSLRGEHFVWEKTQAMTASTSEYDIPERAMGLVLRDLFFTDSNNNTRDIAYLDPEDRDTRSSGSSLGYQWYFKWDKIVITPTPGAGETGSLLIPYFIRPGKLVDTDEAMQITAIDTGTNTVTGSAVPSDFTDGLSYDFIAETGARQYRGIDYVSSSSTSTTIVFSSLPSDLAVGDWVAAQFESPIPQIPREWCSVLANATAWEILEAQGDPKAGKALERYERKLKAVMDLAVPRVQGEPQIVMTNNTRNREWNW